MAPDFGNSHISMIYGSFRASLEGLRDIDVDADVDIDMDIDIDVRT